jgi:hypothetical protein
MITAVKGFVADTPQKVVSIRNNFYKKCCCRFFTQKKGWQQHFAGIEYLRPENGSL